MNPKYVIGAVFACALSFSSTAAVAHGGASGVVKERMELMKDLKTSMKSLSAMFSGKAEYDAEKVRQAARVLKQNSGESMTRLFPEGSLHNPTEAKANIWQEWEHFGQLANDLGTFSEALANSADKRAMMGNAKKSASMMGGDHQMNADSMMGGSHKMGADSMMGSGQMMGGKRPSPEHLAQMPAEGLFKMVTDSCSSCHTRYRQEDK